MNAGQLLQVVKDLVVLLEAQGILLPDGTFDQTKVDTIEENIDFAILVQKLLETHGVVLPDRVNKIIQIIPLLVGIIR